MSSESKLRVRRVFTAEFKREAVELIRKQGLSVAEAARRLDVRETLLRRWRKELEAMMAPVAGQPTALEAEVRQLREEVRRLMMERDVLKKATAFFARESK
jgi:transposase